MQALGIPTSRALSIVSLPEVQVARERMEFASVVTRIAPSFIRIGSFEAFNGPANMFFFGGGQQDPHLDGLRKLGEWVSTRVLKLGVDPGEAWGQRLVMEVAKRNAKMVAGWQAYVFMHGVINTDKCAPDPESSRFCVDIVISVSILGLTIDYGLRLLLFSVLSQLKCNKVHMPLWMSSIHSTSATTQTNLAGTHTWWVAPFFSKNP